jgi:hypothetical protein
MSFKWLELAKELQSIAQAGLTYSKDIYDLERFEQIRQLSIKVMSQFTDTDMTVVKQLQMKRDMPHRKWILGLLFLGMRRY